MSDRVSTGPAEMSLEERKALLATAFEHGQAITRLVVRGGSFAALADYVAAHDDITDTPAPNGRRLTFAEVVYWEVSVDGTGNTQGILQSGYLPLMARLGIDFSGAPFGEDNG